MKLERKVKELMEQRVEKVSPDAWERLENMLAEEKKNSGINISNRRLGLFAASVVLIVCLVLVPFSRNQEKENIVVNTPKKEITQPSLQEQPQIKKEEQEIRTNESNSFKKQAIEEQVIEEHRNEKSEFSLMVQNEIEDFRDSNELLLEIDSVKVWEELPKNETQLVFEEIKETKKMEFVDPEMLLYSIENNESVKQVKSKESLVFIDLNKD